METYHTHLEIGKITIEKLHEMEKSMVSSLSRLAKNFRQTLRYFFNTPKNEVVKADIRKFEARILEIQKSIKKSEKMHDLVIETYEINRQSDTKETE